MTSDVGGEGRAGTVRLELGTRVVSADGIEGQLVEVVIDPTTKRVTHLVAEARGEPWLARLVPVELADVSDGVIRLRATEEEIRRLPPAHEVAYLRLDGFPVEDPDWDVGIQEVLALPYYPSYDLEPLPLDYEVAYDRIPKGEVEIRRASDVRSADGHHLGEVDGFVVDPDNRVTHLVLERGHAWGRRDVTVPIGAVAGAETDAITLKLTKDEVGALPAVAVHRWPQEHSR
jgi:sporulation protein YlmC with PRC-barrel domain